MSKFDALCDKIRDVQRLAIAFSGGTDSTFLAAAAGKCLPKDDILLLHVDSVLLPPSDRGFAVQWAAKNDFRLETVALDPLGDTEIAANDRLRCYYCKKRVFSELYAHARDLGFETLADGANCDDLGDYRPGMDAARELGIAHPLLDCGFSKRDIRYFARELGLVNADAPARHVWRPGFPPVLRLPGKHCVWQAMRNPYSWTSVSTESGYGSSVRWLKSRHLPPTCRECLTSGRPSRIN